MRYRNIEKWKQIKLEDDNYYVILDFDQTITSQKSLDSWMAILDFEIYGEVCKQEIETLNSQYAPIELDYTLDQKYKEQLIMEWYQKSMDLLYKYQLTNSKLQKAIQKGTLKFREGAKQFLEKMYRKNIPVIILSAGIGNAIEQFLKKEKCYYDNIYIISNFITFTDDKMEKFTDTMLHSMNKKIEGRLPEVLQNTINKKQYAILCGDILEDIQMISKEKLERTITIAFLNKNIEQNIKYYQESYDVVLTKEDACFQEVEKIIKEERKMRK